MFERCDRICSVNINNNNSDRLFDGIKSLKEVVFEDSVTIIGSSAFWSCDSLTSVVIGKNVKTINNNAFSWAKKIIWLTEEPPVGYAKTRGEINYVMNDKYSELKNQHIYPLLNSSFKVDGIEYVPSDDNPDASCDVIGYSFLSPTQIINIPNIVKGNHKNYNVCRILPYAFHANNNVTSVTINSGINYIGTYAFGDCNNLSQIKIETENTNYDSRDNCNAIVETRTNKLIQGCKSTVIPTSIESIGDSAFYRLSSLNNLIIPNNIKSIGKYAFYRCNKLNSITLSEGLLSIGDNAFSDCNSLKSLTIPASIEKIGNEAFISCSNITNCFIDIDTLNHKTAGLIPPTTKQLKLGDNVSNITFSENFPAKEIEHLDIGNGVKSIYRKSFYRCFKLTSVSLGKNINSIGEFAFSYCPIENLKIDTKNVSSWFKGFTSLKNVEFGDNVESIGNMAFSGCSNITNIVLGNNISSIGTMAFANCSGLTSLHLPKNLKSFKSNAFEGCYNLCSLSIDSYNIGDSWFEDWHSLKKVEFGNSVCSIGAESFSNCTSLNDIIIPNNIKTIGNVAFWGCTGATNIYIGDSVKAIGYKAFNHCKEAKKLTLGKELKTIGENAFSGCTSLEQIISKSECPPICDDDVFGGVDKNLCKLQVPDGCVPDYKKAEQWKEFFGIYDTGIKDAYIPNSISYILTLNFPIVRSDDALTKQLSASVIIDL